MTNDSSMIVEAESTQAIEDWPADAEDWDEGSAAPSEADKTGHFWMLFALMVLAAATLLVLQAGRPEPPAEFEGRALPPLEVGGWINTQQPLTAADLRGKVVLVNFWATDCVACVRQLPNLLSFARRFRDQDILIVGITAESDALGRVSRFVEAAPGLEWPTAYGAGMVFELMGINYTPTYILYDREGKSVWGGHSIDDLEEAAIKALAKKQ